MKISGKHLAGWLNNNDGLFESVQSALEEAIKDYVHEELGLSGDTSKLEFELREAVSAVFYCDGNYLTPETHDKHHNPARRPMKVLSVSEWTQKVLKVLAEHADQPTRNSARECLKRLQAGLPPAIGAYGGFINKVLAGDVEGAFYAADLHNGQILTEENLWGDFDGQTRFSGRRYHG